MPLDPLTLAAGVCCTICAILTAGKIERRLKHRRLHPRPRGRMRNRIRTKMGLEWKHYSRPRGVDVDNRVCEDPECTHPSLPPEVESAAAVMPSAAPMVGAGGALVEGEITLTGSPGMIRELVLGYISRVKVFLRLCMRSMLRLL